MVSQLKNPVVDFSPMLSRLMMNQNLIVGLGLTLMVNKFPPFLFQR